MKILTLNWSYKVYSIGKIIKDIELSLDNRENVEFVHCYEFGERSDDCNTYRLSGNIEYKMYWILAHLTGLQYAAGVFSNIRLRRIIESEKPDIVHVHCPNAFSVNLYELFDFLKSRKIATVITNHAEFYFTGNCAHAEECKGYMEGCTRCERWKEASHSWLFNRTEQAWRLMEKSFEGFDRVQLVAVSPWAEQRIRESVILGQLPCCTIYNGIDTDVFRPLQLLSVSGNEHSDSYSSYRENAVSEVSGESVEEGQKTPILLHVTSRFSDEEADLKGGVFVLQLAERLQNKNVNCRIVVAGATALHKSYDKLRNIELLGQIRDQRRLAALYAKANLLIMTSKRETFGMTCAESMCCGTPVVGFENGGTESIALTRYSEFVPYGNLDELEAAALKWLERKREFKGDLSSEAAKAYGKDAMAEGYYSLYKSLVSV